jgi:hypothetical protein
MIKICARNRSFRSLLRERRAVSYMEFAMTAPMVIMALLMGGELANLSITHTRISQIAHMTADNASRVRDRIDEADLNEIFIGDKLAGGTLDVLEHGRIIVSSIEDNEDTPNNTNDQRITWQRCKGMKSVTSAYGAEGAILPEPIGSGTRRIKAMPGEPLIAVEIQYDYQPLFGNGIYGPQTISYSYSYLLRDRSDNSLQNGGNLGGTAKATCNFYNSTT